MNVLKFDKEKLGGKFKPLNATNGGTWHKRHANDQFRSNFADYKAARIPYTRNHDANYCSVYGGPYAYDITAIFPNFDADVENPASYDFACTDEDILKNLDAGTQTFFRLGQSIEHHIKKHATLPPADFNKWAQICEHVIRHYNEGWADGFTLDIQYWEIWNEPDLDEDDCEHKRTWGGTKKQFFDMYEITANHLKNCFPELKIGGPALAWREDWGADFIAEMSMRKVPIDFFSWHIYCTEPYHMTDKAARIRKMLDENGYEKTESILNEWNYVKGWEEEFVYSLKSIHGIKGAAFVMSCMSEAQKSKDIDMLMYYDTRPSVFNGAFDFYTYEKLKGYYPLKWYGMFYDMESEIKSETSIKGIYTLCGIDKNGKTLCVVTYYTDDDNAPPQDVKVDFGCEGEYEIHLLDNEKDGEFVGVTKELEFTMNCQSCILIKER